MPNQESSVGPVVATIIILAVVVFGGLYFWGQHKDANSTDTIQTATTTQSTSDDTSSIEADLNNTNTEVDTEIQAS